MGLMSFNNNLWQSCSCSRLKPSFNVPVPCRR